MTPMLSRRIYERSKRRWRTHIGGSSAEGFGKVDDCDLTNEELEMSTCEVADVDDVPVRTPGLRGLQIHYSYITGSCKCNVEVAADK